MNFGQYWRTPGIVDVPYSVELPERYWIELIARELPEHVADAKLFPDPDDEFELALRRHGWPEAREVCAVPELAPLAVLEFAHDLLLEWLGDGPPDEEPGWVINTIDGGQIDGDRVRLWGSARRGGIPVRYQDV